MNELDKGPESPISRLPQELLEIIFVDYLHLYSFEEGNGRKGIIGCRGPLPVDLLLVCRGWRRIVLSNHKLFIRIAITDNRFSPYKIIPTWIRRSGSLPLEVAITPERWNGTVDSKTKLLQFLGKQMHRIRILKMSYTPYFDTLFPPDSITLAPMLQYLRLSSPTFNSFVSNTIVWRSGGIIAENLQSLTLNTEIPLWRVNLPLGPMLISFDGRNCVYGPREAARLLSMCPNLRTCSLDYGEDSVSPQPTDADLTANIILLHLVAFDIKFHKTTPSSRAPSHFNRVARRLDTPSLQKLRLDASDILDRPFNFDNLVAKPQERWLSQCHPPLQKLSLVSFSSLELGTFRQILEAVPGISELELQGWKLSCDQLNILNRGLNPSICPRLDVLSVHSSILLADAEELISVIYSRLASDTGDEGDQPLTKLTVSNLRDEKLMHMGYEFLEAHSFPDFTIVL